MPAPAFIALPPSSQPVGRLAPSPTGGLHLGNARTFLAAWLLARKSSGRIVFRMEDLDSTRARDDAAQAALVDLAWLGLNWDEGPDIGGPHYPYSQSRRSSLYQSALHNLAEKELVYPCTCTRTDVQRAASAPHVSDETPAYPGTCAYRSASDAATFASQGRSFAWRFRTTHQSVRWHDQLQGDFHHDLAKIGGDFIVARSGGIFGYQLAVVVDDAAMGINQVVRGDDLMESTPRQILLQQALSFNRPDYFHLGLVLDKNGQRLAKRDQSLKLSSIRNAGISPEKLVGLLAQSLGFEVEGKLANPDDLLHHSWPDTATSRLIQPWIFDPAELTG